MCHCVDPGLPGTHLIKNYFVILDPANPRFECIECHRTFPIRDFTFYELYYDEIITIGWGGSPSDYSGRESARYQFTLLEHTPTRAYYQLEIKFNFNVYSFWPETVYSDQEASIITTHYVSVVRSGARVGAKYDNDNKPTKVRWQTIDLTGELQTLISCSRPHEEKDGYHNSSLHQNFRLS